MKKSPSTLLWITLLIGTVVVAYFALSGGTTELQGSLKNVQNRQTPPVAKDCSDKSDTKDTDGDGLSLRRECELGTKPKVADTDKDGLNDGEELMNLSDPLKKDTDDDGLDDWLESQHGGLLPYDPDSDDDGLLDGEELISIGVVVSLPDKADSDNDGLDDYQEVKVHGTDPKKIDTDGDAWQDLEEVEYGTDPTDCADNPDVRTAADAGQVLDTCPSN